MPIGAPYRETKWLTHLGLGVQFVLSGIFFVAQLGADMGVWRGPSTLEAPVWWYPIALYALVGAGLASPIGIWRRKAWGYFLEAPLVAFILYASWEPLVQNGKVANANLPWVEPLFRWGMAFLFISAVWEVLSCGFAELRRGRQVPPIDSAEAPGVLNRKSLEQARTLQMPNRPSDSA